MTAKPTKGLGRGLSSLMGEANITQIEAAPAKNNVSTAHVVAINGDMSGAVHLPAAQLQPGKYQPRRHFDEESLTELADSIEKHGVIEPLVVRVVAKNTYEIIAGERRWRAATLAKVENVPVIIREVDDSTALELALIENIQRADLNPLEEAAGYQRLMEEFHYTQEKLAPIVGKSRSHIANLLRLLKLPDSIKKRIDSGDLTMGHARAILMAKNPEELAQQIVQTGLSVRQAEERAKGEGAAPNAAATPAAKSSNVRGDAAAPRREATSANKSDDVMQLENMLAESLGLRVSIDARGAQAGEVIISYDSLNQLDEILRRLGGGA